MAITPTPSASSRTTGVRVQRRRLLAVWLAAAIPIAAADERRITDAPLDFSLYLSRTKADIDYPTARIPTRIDRIGIHWRERYPPLLLGLIGGYSYVTQTQNVPTAGLELSGYHVGVTFEIEMLKVESLRVSVGGAYLYERVKEDSGTNRVELAWHLPTAQLLAQWHATRRWELYGGAHHGYLAGEERLRGAINITEDIERRAATGGIAGIRLHLDDTGYVTLEGNSGATRSVALYFGRRY